MNYYEKNGEKYILYNKIEIHVILDNDDLFWFNANDIASSFGYKIPKDAIRDNVLIANKIKLKHINYDIKTGQLSKYYIDEPGIYQLMLKSKLPYAKKMVSWITKDVLPSIRKTRKYIMKKEFEGQMKQLVDKLTDLEKRNEILQNDLNPQKFHNGGMVYAIDYSTDDDKDVYKIGTLKML